MTPITVTACGLPAIPTRFRTVEDEVNRTASKPPPLIASRTGAGGGAARTVRYAVTSSASQPRSISRASSVSVAMSARGSSTRLIGSSTSSYGGQAAARPSADCSPPGTRSGRMPKSSSAAEVCSPTAATLTPANARASRPYSSKRSRIARTALTDVKATHWYRPVTRPLTARSICCGVRGGSTAMVGTSSGTAPYSRRRSRHHGGLLLGPGHQHPPAEQRLGLEPRQRVPGRHRVADHGHRRAGRVVASDTPAALRSGPMRPRVEATVCCALVAPSQVTANGVVSGQPAAISILASSAGPASAPSTTSVAGL